MSLTQRFAVQILIALIHWSRNNVIHWDLKPENILLKRINKSGIKIIDFGSGWFSDKRIYTYIQSRFYRAPEIVLGIPYGVEIDMWSFGWIIWELDTGWPIFPWENEEELILSMQEYIGIPPEYILKKSITKSKFYDEFGNPLTYITNKGKKTVPNSKTIKEFLTTKDDDFIDFIEKWIWWDPQKRLKCEDAFKHPWISHFIDNLKVSI